MMEETKYAATGDASTVEGAFAKHEVVGYVEELVPSMAQDCEAWQKKVLLDGETVTKHLVAYRTGRRSIPWWNYLLILPLLQFAFEWCFQRVCPCCGKLINHERVFVGLTSKRRILYWKCSQMGARSMSGSRVMDTRTNVGIFQLDALSEIDVGFSREAPLCMPGKACCVHHFNGQLSMYFGPIRRSLLTTPIANLVHAHYITAGDVRMLWFSFAAVRDVIRNVMLRFAATARLALFGAVALPEPELCDDQTAFRFSTGDHCVRAEGKSALETVLAFEAAVLAEKPGALAKDAASSDPATTDNFTTEGDKDLVEGGKVNIAPAFIPLAPGETILDAWAHTNAWTFELVWLCIISLGLYYFRFVRPMLKTKSAIVVTSHRVIEMSAMGPLSTDNEDLTYAKKWFPMTPAAKAFKSMASRNTINAVVRGSNMLSIQVNLSVPQACWNIIGSTLTDADKTRMHGFLARFHGDLSTVNVDATADAASVFGELLDIWQQMGVKPLADEKVVAVLKNKGLFANCNPALLMRILTCGLLPWNIEETVILTNQRVIGFVGVKPTSFLCPTMKVTRAAAFWAPVSEMYAGSVVGQHILQETLLNRLLPRICAAGTTTVAVSPAVLGGFPIPTVSGTFLHVGQGGLLEESDLETFVSKLGQLASAAQEARGTDPIFFV